MYGLERACCHLVDDVFKQTARLAAERNRAKPWGTRQNKTPVLLRTRGHRGNEIGNEISDLLQDARCGGGRRAGRVAIKQCW